MDPFRLSLNRKSHVLHDLECKQPVGQGAVPPMNMPAPMELVAIAMMALLIFGPRKMPEIGRSIGQALREFRRTSQEVMDTIHGAMEAEEPEPAPKRSIAPRTEEED